MSKIKVVSREVITTNSMVLYFPSWHLGSTVSRFGSEVVEIYELFLCDFLVKFEVSIEAKDATFSFPCLMFGETEPQGIPKLFLEHFDLDI